MNWLLSGFPSIMLPLDFSLVAILCPLWGQGAFLVLDPLTQFHLYLDHFSTVLILLISDKMSHTKEKFPGHPFWNRFPTLNLFSLSKHLLISPTEPIRTFGYLVYQGILFLICVSPISHSGSLKLQCLPHVTFFINFE